MKIQILASFSYQAFIFTHFPIILREKKFRFIGTLRNQLKKALKQLKERNDSPEKEIVYVSKLLRSKFGKKGNKSDVFKQELKFKEDIWKFCKSNMETKKDQMGVPTFDEKKCYNHFRNSCEAKHRNKRFDFPSCRMKLLHEPTSCFNQEPPKYLPWKGILIGKTRRQTRKWLDGKEEEKNALESCDSPLSLLGQSHLGSRT